MGLDMNLFGRSPLYQNESEEELFKAYKAINNLPYPAWREIKEKAPDAPPLVDVCYWRKANMVHNYFMECDGHWVEGFGDDSGNCGYKRITREAIDRLIEICWKIVEQGFDYEGKHYNTTTENLSKKDATKVSFPTAFAIENLPTQEGFFFGFYEYDGFYLYDVADTYERLVAAKESGKLDGDLYYHPWW